MSERILVVDDDDLVRSGLAVNLRAEGYDVLTAASGEEALEAVSREPVSLILCDVVMDGMDGLEVLRRVQNKWPATAVIMITGHGTINNALDALKAGASDYIQKPVSPAEVAHRIRNVLEAARLRASLTTERKRSESRKKELNDQLIRAERMSSLGLLAEGAASDLTSVLKPLAELPDHLRRLLPDSKDARATLVQIEEMARKTSAALRDLQSIGRVKPSEKTSVRLRELVEQFTRTEEFARLRDACPGTRLKFHADANIPVFQGAERQIQDALFTLVANAFETSPSRGEVRLTVTCERVEHAVGRYGSSAAGEYVIVRVEDRGPGLQAEDLERIFEPFYIQKKLRRRLVSGLGMTLVHRAVEDHGGFIDITVTPGGGNVFHVYLPTARHGRDTLSQTHADFSGAETILVVDDYREERDKAAQILAGAGYNVLTAAHGREAMRVIERARREGAPVDLVVLDLILGDDLDGVATYRKILEIAPEQKAVIVSGFADLARIVEGRKLGIRHVVRKPYALETLGRAVRAELDG
jgi:DNA-binding response OmpR family regulator